MPKVRLTSGLAKRHESLAERAARLAMAADERRKLSPELGDFIR
jgi:hypothetical protein